MMKKILLGVLFLFLFSGCLNTINEAQEITNFKSEVPTNGNYIHTYELTRHEGKASYKLDNNKTIECFDCYVLMEWTRGTPPGPCDKNEICIGLNIDYNAQPNGWLVAISFPPWTFDPMTPNIASYSTLWISKDYFTIDKNGNKLTFTPKEES